MAEEEGRASEAQGAGVRAARGGQSVTEALSVEQQLMAFHEKEEDEQEVYVRKRPARKEEAAPVTPGGANAEGGDGRPRGPKRPAGKGKRPAEESGSAEQARQPADPSGPRQSRRRQGCGRAAGSARPGTAAASTRRAARSRLGLSARGPPRGVQGCSTTPTALFRAGGISWMSIGSLGDSAHRGWRAMVEKEARLVTWAQAL